MQLHAHGRAKVGRRRTHLRRAARAFFPDSIRAAAGTNVAAVARAMADLYDMQHDPALQDRLTYASPTSGHRVGLSFIQPRSVDDLVRRRDMVKTCMDATCGMFGRSPDFMSIMVMGFACAGGVRRSG